MVINGKKTLRPPVLVVWLAPLVTAQDQRQSLRGILAWTATDQYMDCEKYTLAPSVIADKARQLHSVGLHAQALALLQRNCVEARVYATYVEMSIPRPEKKPNKSHWKKGHGVRKGVKKTDED